jgi:DNA-binding response OmpR family regulator
MTTDTTGGPTRLGKILIVDDDPDMLELVALNLEAAGFGVAQLDGGQDAKSAVFHLAPDLVVLDVMMPHVDGFGVLAAMRADERTASVPVVLLSAKATPEDIEAGLAAGADAYLTKPFDPDELQATIEQLLWAL